MLIEIYSFRPVSMRNIENFSVKLREEFVPSSVLDEEEVHEEPAAPVATNSLFPAGFSGAAQTGVPQFLPPPFYPQIYNPYFPYYPLLPQAAQASAAQVTAHSAAQPVANSAGDHGDDVQVSAI